MYDNNKKKIKKIGLILTISLFFMILIPNNNFHVERKDYKTLDSTPKTSVQSVSPMELGQYSDNYNNTRDVFVFGDIAYVADSTDGLEIINISDPTNPFLISRFGDSYNDSCSLEVSNGIAYVVDIAFSFEIINVSDPTKPSKLGEIHRNDYP